MGAEWNSKTDLDIARAASLKPLPEIAAQMGLGEHLLEPYGSSMAKIRLDAIQPPRSEQGNATAAPVIDALREAREARDAKTPGSIPEAAPQAREGSEISH